MKAEEAVLFIGLSPLWCWGLDPFTGAAVYSPQRAYFRDPFSITCSDARGISANDVSQKNKACVGVDLDCLVKESLQRHRLYLLWGYCIICGLICNFRGQETDGESGWKMSASDFSFVLLSLHTQLLFLHEFKSLSGSLQVKFSTQGKER